MATMRYLVHDVGAAISFYVDGLDARVEELGARGAVFRNEVVEGPGGRQILVEDPSGNVVELFEPGS